MKLDYLPKALDALEDAPAAVRKAFFKQVKFQHASIRKFEPTCSSPRRTPMLRVIREFSGRECLDVQAEDSEEESGRF